MKQKKRGIVIERRWTGRLIVKYYGMNGELIASSQPLSGYQQCEKNIAAMSVCVDRQVEGESGKEAWVSYPNGAMLTVDEVRAKRDEKDAGH